MIKLLIIILLLFIYPATARSAVAIVNTPTAFDSAASQSSYTYSFQCNSGTTSLLLSVHSYTSFSGGGAHQISSATYNSVAATVLGGYGGFEDVVAIGLNAPSIGASHNFVINYTVNPPFGIGMRALCLSGSHASTAFGNVAGFTDNNKSSPATTNITATSGSMVFDFTTTSTTLAVDGSQTELFNTTWGGTRISSSRKESATAMTWTFSGTARFSHVVVEVKAAAAGPGATVRHRQVVSP